MTNAAAAALAAITLAGSVPSFAAASPADPHHPQPSSYAPSPHSGPHVYGSPIETGGVGHAEGVHHKHAAPKKPAGEPKHGTRGHSAQGRRPADGSSRTAR